VDEGKFPGNLEMSALWRRVHDLTHNHALHIPTRSTNQPTNQPTNQSKSPLVVVQVMSDWERARTLSFVVVGAGPTGIEFTGELRDFIEKDVARFYPHLLPYISIKILEASDKVLMQFEESLQVTCGPHLLILYELIRHKTHLSSFCTPHHTVPLWLFKHTETLNPKLYHYGSSSALVHQANPYKPEP